METSLIWRSTFDFCMSDKGKLSTRLKRQNNTNSSEHKPSRTKKQNGEFLYYNISEQNKYTRLIEYNNLRKCLKDVEASNTKIYDIYLNIR